MIRCTLQRLKEFKDVAWKDKPVEDSTLGHFVAIDEDTNEELFSCYTIENGGPSTDTPNQDKRIMPRVYSFQWTKSSKTPKGEDLCLWLHTEELPSFANRRILIHVGNAPQDTEGCILLNTSNSGNGTGGGSVAACKEFYTLVKNKGIENFTLEVKEITEN